MNIILCEADELEDGNRLRLCDWRAVQLWEVKRLREGSSIRVGILDGPLFAAQVESADAKECCLRLNVEQVLEQPASLPCTLVLALPRPQSLKKILQTVAELGLEELRLVSSERVQKSYFQSTVLQPEELQYYLALGLAQAGATRLPRIRICRRFQSCLEGLDISRSAWVADPDAGDELAGVCCDMSERRQEMLLAVGPEGGWTEKELEWFSRKGLRAIRSGERVLRVDTAVTVLLGQLALLQRGEGSDLRARGYEANA